MRIWLKRIVIERRHRSSEIWDVATDLIVQMSETSDPEEHKLNVPRPDTTALDGVIESIKRQLSAETGSTVE
jgi:hypothetical protein